MTRPLDSTGRLASRAGARSIDDDALLAEERARPGRERALHELVAGAALRAASLASPLVAFAALLLAKGERAGFLPAAATTTFVAALVAFLLERRAARAPEVLGRALIAGFAGGALVPAALACADHAGSPGDMLDALADVLRHPLRLVWTSFVAAALAPAWALLLFVRARTARLWPQSAAGAITGLLGAHALELSTGRGSDAAAFVLISLGACAGLALGLADRWLAPRFDPAAPAPVERAVGGLLWTWLLLAVLCGGVHLVEV